jgi:hypothetical protein
MARVIEFYVPLRFTQKTSKWVPLEKRGKLLAFPTNVNTRPRLQEEWPPVVVTKDWKESNSMLTQLLWVLIRPA